PRSRRPRHVRPQRRTSGAQTTGGAPVRGGGTPPARGGRGGGAVGRPPADQNAKNSRKRPLRPPLPFHRGPRALPRPAPRRRGSATVSAGPSRVVQGNPATFSVSVSPAGARCSLSVRYRSGARQKGLKTLTAANGSATWTWTVPRNAQPGLTHDTASCAGAG